MLFRPINKNDLDRLRDWRNNPLVSKWCRQTDYIGELQHQEWYIKQKEDPTIVMYAICLTNRRLIGVCGLTSIKLINKTAEFSLYIGPDNWGKGYGQEALTTLLGRGFNTYNLNLIWGETFDGNPATRIFNKVGFSKEGTRRQFYFKDGKYIDAHLYSITKDEFCKQQT